MIIPVNFLSATQLYSTLNWIVFRSQFDLLELWVAIRVDDVLQEAPIRLEEKNPRKGDVDIHCLCPFLFILVRASFAKGESNFTSTDVIGY